MNAHAQEIQLASGQVLKDRDISFMQGFLVVQNGDDQPRWINLNQVAEMRGVIASKGRAGLY